MQTQTALPTYAAVASTPAQSIADSVRDEITEITLGEIETAVQFDREQGTALVPAITEQVLAGTFEAFLLTLAGMGPQRSELASHYAGRLYNEALRLAKEVA